MFRRILFCTDFSENAHLAFTYALNLAKTYERELLILHVAHEPFYVCTDAFAPYLTGEALESIEASEKEKTDRELKTYYLEKMDGFKSYKVLLKKGVPFYEIIQTAKEETVDLIVPGTHGRTGLDHILFGSTAERVVRKSSSPVLTVRLPGKRFVIP